ncbi:MAG: hypothetical protein ACUVTZ_00850 [Armatimonadota bacterium]
MPGFATPLQAIIALLLQILMFVAAGIAGLLSLRAWQVLCLNAASGRPLWRHDLRKRAMTDASVLSSPAVANRRLHEGCTKGHLICLCGLYPILLTVDRS